MFKKHSLIIASALVSSLIFSSGNVFGKDEDLQKSLTNLIRQFEQQHHISGSLYVIRDGQHFAASAGFANRRTRLLNGPDVLYMLASNSKHFVATSLLKLEEMGRLHVDDPVAKYFPEVPARQFRFNDRDLLISDMLRNTSGLYNPSVSPIVSRKFQKEPIAMDEIVNVYRTLPLLFEPGSEFDYQDVNFILGGEIVRRASRMSYERFLQKFLTHRLGLRDIQVDNLKNPDRIARSYVVHSDGQRVDYFKKFYVHETHTSEVFSDGNIYATSKDIAQWILHLANGDVICEMLLTRMLTPGPASIEVGGRYGFAINIYDWPLGGKQLEHWGHYAGYNSFITAFPETKTAIVWLGNQAFGPEQSDFHKSVIQTVTGHRPK